MHDGIIVIRKAISARLYRVLHELVKVPRLDILCDDLDEVVSVWACVFMPISKCVAYLMHDGA